MPSLREEMERDAVDASDTLSLIRDHAANLRDLTRKINDLTDSLKSLEAEKRRLETETLPNLLEEVGLHEFYLPPRGNLPGLEIKLSDYYRANIAASWDLKQRVTAFNTLERLGLSDIIKNIVTSTFTRGNNTDAKALYENLSRQGIDCDINQFVSHQTLTSAFKELCLSGRRPSAADMNAIGATTGKIVKVAERRE